VNRRAFLTLGRRGRKRVVGLSCERLYMRWVDATTHAAHAHAPDELFGEPPTKVAAETTDDLFAELDRELATADVLRITDEAWLRTPELRERVEAGVRAFERRGGRVERAVRALVVALAFLVFGVVPAAAQSSAADEALRARVEAAVAAASDLPADSISVQVQGGVVTLSGSVVCEDCGGSSTPGGAGTVQQTLGAVVRAIPGVETLRFSLRYRPVASR
jgi:hypothetical protein